MKKQGKKSVIKAELKNGARYAYVCTTVYPDISGKVMIGGTPHIAYSSGTFYRGDIVLCRKNTDGTAEIPLL